MAGIAGAAGGRQVEWVESALRKIGHRGGAGTSARTTDDASLGQVWPLAQEQFGAGADRLPVVLDGEIYNWTTLWPGATCALEGLQGAYRTKGPEFVLDIDGPFALAIATEGGLFLARDPVGRSPLYYGDREGALCFASEFKALLGWVSDIAAFPPGHYWQPGRGLVRFARIEAGRQLDMPEGEVARELRGRLVMSVSKRLRWGEVGAWLSGGIDSATLTALARRQLPGLKTFAAGVQGAPDLEYARSVADFLQTEHYERFCDLQEMLAVLPHVIYYLESFDALLVRSSITNFMVGRLASEHVPAVLSGEGGDELFAGYARLKDLDHEELPDELVDITRRLHNTALQRVDRCSASHGLVARTAFLDRDVMEFAMRIPPELKIYEEEGPVENVEKWILRQAMDGLLPEDVLSRRKAKFWQGAGVGDQLASHAEQSISDAEFANERTLEDGTVLNTKEELLYYRIFRDVFGTEIDARLVGRTKGAPIAN